LPREEARALWLAKLEAVGFFNRIDEETIPVQEAAGRVAARTLYARRSVPHYNAAAMDGLAVRARDTFGAAETSPKRLRVLPAGQEFSSGGCFIVDTGDVLPLSTDAVIMVEDVHIDGEWAEITAAVAPWHNVRVIGEDIVEGEMVVPEWRRLAPPDIAALLAAGLDKIPVIRRPRVAIQPTGTELIPPDMEPAAGEIVDVNSQMIAAAVRDWGGEPVCLPIVPDNAGCLREAVRQGLETCDAIIVNAGTALGREDFTATVFAELGEVVAHGVAIKPGKPVVLAICQGKPAIGLPGYPVSAMLTAEIFVKEMLCRKLCLTPVPPRVVRAVLARSIHSAVGVEEYIRVSLGTVQGRLVAAPLGRGAGLISSLVKAHGLAIVGAAAEGVAGGTEIDVRLLSDDNPEDNLLAIGSHDLALEVLGVHLRRRYGLRLGCANVGSMGGITAIRNNEAHLAGIHLLDERTGTYNQEAFKRFLGGSGRQLVRFAGREQGLLVRAGNPKNIREIVDLARPDVIFVNRQRGSGTRMLLDYLLRKSAIGPEAVAGYENEAATHMAVAACVAGGVADAGLGIRAAAKPLGLDFIPIAWEEYDLILNFGPEDKRADAVLSVLSDPAFRQEVEALGGYDLSSAGAIVIS